jgi:hypothetical protein
MLTRSSLSELFARATQPLDIAFLAAFRIGLGLVLLFSTLRFVAKGWVTTLLVAPSLHFTYSPAPFVRPLPAQAMFALFALLALAALGIAVGYRYRLCVWAFFIGFTYVELIEKATYLNHYYFVSVVTLLLGLLPAANAASLDVRFGRSARYDSVPAWVQWALRLQVGVVYFFAGVAKLNADWLLHAQPLRIWLAARSDLPFIGPWLEEPLLAYVFSWSGAVFDLGIVFFLSNRRMRPYAFAVLVAFHLITSVLFPIGVFPFLMVLGATVFFEASWARRWLGLGGLTQQSGTPSRAAVCAVALHVCLQLAIPVRQHLLRSAWTLRGFDFAWNVMVAEKAGFARFEARDKHTGESFAIEPQRYLAPFQERAMTQDPAMIRQFAQLAAREIARRDGREVEIRAEAWATLNGRASQQLVDPRVDLADPRVNRFMLDGP